MNVVLPRLAAVVAVAVMPLVYAHVNGFSVIGVHLPQSLHNGAAAMQVAQLLAAEALGTAKLAVFLSGVCAALDCT